MGLLLDMEGHPIGFDLFPGNTNDGATLSQAITALKERFYIRHLIFVADQGINSKKNLHHIKGAGYEYIVSARLKNSSKVLKQQILSPEGYVILHKNEEGQPTFKYKVISDHCFTYKDEDGKVHEFTDNLVIYWSEDRAQRDRQERERQMQKAAAMIDEKNSLSNKKGYRRYIATEGSQEILGIDENRIAEDELWDGYAAIQSSQANMDATSVIDAYHQLWQIESAFRILKSTMRTRPIFHWTPSRIVGHFVTCFLAFVLERALEVKLKSNQELVSPERIQESLNSLQVSEIKLGEGRYYLKSKNDSLASRILNIMRIKHLKNVTAKEEFVPLFER
jgi:transposase